MEWILFVVIGTTALSDNKAINTSAVPMASLELCTQAKEKLAELHKATQSPNFMMVTECLRSR